jgi:hypothetical protein
MSGKFQIDVCNLSDADVAQLEKQGVSNIRFEGERDDDYEPRGHFLTLRSNAVSKAGDNLDPPKVVDALKKPLPRGVLVGNGSTVKVVYDPFEWTYKNKAGVSAGLRIVQVIELVKFEGGSGLDDLEEEEGFTAPDDGLGDLDETADDADLAEEKDDDEIPF